jgi:hypothetical protein
VHKHGGRTQHNGVSEACDPVARSRAMSTINLICRFCLLILYSTFVHCPLLLRIASDGQRLGLLGVGGLLRFMTYPFLSPCCLDTLSSRPRLVAIGGSSALGQVTSTFFANAAAATLSRHAAVTRLAPISCQLTRLARVYRLSSHSHQLR